MNEYSTLDTIENDANYIAARVLEGKDYGVKNGAWFSEKTCNIYTVAIDYGRDALVFAACRLVEGEFENDRFNRADFEADAFEYLQQNARFAGLAVRLDSIQARHGDTGPCFVRHYVDVLGK